MPVTLELQDNEKIMRWAFIDPWIIDDIVSLLSDANRFTAQAIQPLQILIDVSQTHQVPNNILSIRSKVIWKAQDGDQTAVVGTSTFIKVMVEMILKLAHVKRVHFFDTDAEARAYLKSQAHLVD